MDPNQQIQPSSAEDLSNDQYQEDAGKVDIDDIQGKIFIGGLSWQTTEANLRYYFEKFGELADVALMIDKRSGKPRGFGFIKMKDPAAADIVMSNEHTIDGRLVDVKRALPRDKAPGPSRSESCKIFVGGLASEVTEKEFGDYFSKFGIVKDAVVMVDRNTGSSRGFGFVTFEKEESVDAVMNLEHEIMGKYVETKRAEPRDSRGPGGFDGGNMYGNGGGMGYGNSMQMGGYGGGRGGGRGYGGGGGGRGYGGPQSGRGGMMPDNGGYGGGYGGGNFRGGGGNAGYGGRFPAGYGGAAGGAGGYRGGNYGGMAGPGGPGAGYGYNNPAAMNPQAAAGMGYYPGTAGMAAVPGAYGGYGAPVSSAAVAGYGAAVSSYGAPAGRPQQADGGEYGQPVQQPGAQQNKAGYDSSALAGYAAAMQQQQMRSQQQVPQQQALPQQGYYGGAPAQQGMPAAYGAPAYGYPAGAGGQGAATSPNSAGRDDAGQGHMQHGQGQQMYGNAGGGADPQAQGQAGGYGAYRGQGAAQGRVDRSYRPY